MPASINQSWLAGTSKGNLAACLERMQAGGEARRAFMTDSSQSNVPYLQPLLDAVALFDELGIGYALVGGVAAMYYGRARFTEDLDFVATSGHMDILAANSEAMRKHHFDPTCTFKLYHSSGLQIDLWEDRHSDGIVAPSAEVELGGRKVRLADPHDMIAMKLRAGRVRDDYDISEILKGTRIDDALVRQRVTDEEFARYVLIKQRN